MAADRISPDVPVLYCLKGIFAPQRAKCPTDPPRALPYPAAASSAVLRLNISCCHVVRNT